MSQDPVAEALVTLRKNREERVAEVKRLDQAIAALVSLMSASSMNANPKVVRSNSGASSGPSVRAMIVNLLEEADQDWSAGEILAEYERRGTPVHGKRPENGLRAALVDASRADQIVRTGVGRYRATKWASNDPRPFGNHDFGAHRFDTEAAS